MLPGERRTYFLKQTFEPLLLMTSILLSFAYSLAKLNPNLVVVLTFISHLSIFSHARILLSLMLLFSEFLILKIFMNINGNLRLCLLPCLIAEIYAVFWLSLKL